MDVSRLQFTPPTREDLFNWGRDDRLVYALHVGQQPVRTDTEMAEQPDGTWLPRIYAEYAQCTVYIADTGYMAVEYYEAPPSGNPEDGDRVTVYYMQCVAIEAAKFQARMVLMDIENMTEARYIGIGFDKEVL